MAAAENESASTRSAAWLRLRCGRLSAIADNHRVGFLQFSRDHLRRLPVRDSKQNVPRLGLVFGSQDPNNSGAGIALSLLREQNLIGRIPHLSRRQLSRLGLAAAPGVDCGFSLSRTPIPLPRRCSIATSAKFTAAWRASIGRSRHGTGSGFRRTFRFGWNAR